MQFCVQELRVHQEQAIFELYVLGKEWDRRESMGAQQRLEI